MKALVPLLVAAASLSACVVAPLPPYGYRGDVVTVAPPEQQAESYGPPPVVGYVWIGGYWNWVGNRHAWVAGRWAAPRPGYRWSPYRWDRVPGGWRGRPGYWQRY